MTVVIPTCAIAGVIIASVVLTGMGFKLSTGLVSLSGGNLALLLLLTAVASFILGMGTVALVTYIVLVVLVAPALTKLGVMPLAAHLFVFWWGITSFITPPVAVGVFVAAGIAKCDSWKAGWQAVRLGIITFIIPFVFVYNPALLLKGSPTDLILGISSVLVAGFALACGISGYLFRRTTWLERLLLLAGAGLLLIPDLRFVSAGVVVTTLSLISQRRRRAEDVDLASGP